MMVLNAILGAGDSMSCKFEIFYNISTFGENSSIKELCLSTIARLKALIKKVFGPNFTIDFFLSEIELISHPKVSMRI